MVQIVLILDFCQATRAPAIQDASRTFLLSGPTSTLVRQLHVPSILLTLIDN